MPYSLMLDGSNDTGLSKIFPITGRVFDVNFNRVMTKFFDMNLIGSTDAPTAEVMFQSVDNQLNNLDINWDYCIAICLGNTNAIIEDHNSIKSGAKEKNGSIIIAGCPCNILNNASCKAGEMFSQVTNFDIEDHTVDAFHSFDKASEWKSLLKEHYEFCDTDYSEIIKFISTRNFELKNYEWLKSYFLSASGAGDCFRRLKMPFATQYWRSICFFYQGVLPGFTTFNKYFRREETLIYHMSEA